MWGEGGAKLGTANHEVKPGIVEDWLRLTGRAARGYLTGL